MKASIIILVALGMVAAFCAALLTASMTGQKKSAGKGEPIVVLVATRDMPSLTVVTEDAFEEQRVTPTEAPAGVITQPLQIVGKPLARAVVKGQPLTRECFALNSLGVEMVAQMPKGKRAVTVELALSSGHEGLLYPGCVVDVLATFKMDRSGQGAAVSTTLLQGVEVIAIDSETVATADEKADKDGKSAGLNRKTRRVTLMVDPRQAEALQLATEHGTVSLAMRNPLDDATADTEPTLLNQGRLASFAEYLDSAVPHHDDDTPSGLLSSDAPPAQPHAPQRRDITVLRGTDVEVRSLVEEDHSTGKVADRL